MGFQKEDQLVQTLKEIAARSWCFGGPPRLLLGKIWQYNIERGWGFSSTDFPSSRPRFKRRTASEVLLPAVYLPGADGRPGLHRTMDELWSLLAPPDTSYTKWSWVEPMVEKGINPDNQLHMQPMTCHQSGIRWVAFDPYAYRGVSPSNAVEHALAHRQRLAGPEVLLAALLFPFWTEHLGTYMVPDASSQTEPFPLLSGLAVGGFHGSAAAPWYQAPGLYLQREWHELRLGLFSAYGPDAMFQAWSSPTIRELPHK